MKLAEYIEKLKELDPDTEVTVDQVSSRINDQGKRRLYHDDHRVNTNKKPPFPQ